MSGCIRVMISGHAEYRCPLCDSVFKTEEECMDHVIAKHTMKAR